MLVHFTACFFFPLHVYQLFYVERNIRGNFPCPLETKNHPYEFTQLTFLFPSSFFKFTLFNLLISCPDLLLTKLTRDLASRLTNNKLHKHYSNEQINITTTINTEKKKRKLHETILVFTTVLLYNREKTHMAA